MIFIRTSGVRLCGPHFIEHFQDRAARTLREQRSIPSGSLVAVAVSGGKDSTVTLHLLHKLFRRRPDVRLEAITVDEGIPGYRPDGLAAARAACETLGVPHHVVTHESLFGITTQAIAEADPRETPCSYCGVWRRSALNRKAREIGATVLATGHNLDDTCQSLLLNIARGDVPRLARLAPHDTEQPGLVPRILPLRTAPENEVYLYAVLTKAGFHEATCPHYGRAMRNSIREVVFRLEDHHPGTRYAMLRAADDLQRSLAVTHPPVPLGSCIRCGEPTLQGVCEACRRSEQARTLIGGAAPVGGGQ